MVGICNRKYLEMHMNLDNFQLFCDLCKNCFSGERNMVRKFDLMMSFLQQMYMASEPEDIMSKYMNANEREELAALLEMINIFAKIARECELLWCTKGMPQWLRIEHRLGNNDAIARTAPAMLDEKFNISPQQSLCTVSNSRPSDDLQTLFGQMGTSTMPSMKILDQLCCLQDSKELALGDNDSSKLSIFDEVHSTPKQRDDLWWTLTDEPNDIWDDDDAVTHASIEFSRCFLLQDCSDDSHLRGADGDDELMTTSCDNEVVAATKNGLQIKDSLCLYAKKKIRAYSSSDSFAYSRRCVDERISHSSDWLSFENISPSQKSSVSIYAGQKERKLISKLLQIFLNFQPVKTVYCCQCQKQCDDSLAPTQHENTPPKRRKRRPCLKRACSLTSMETVHSFDLKQRQRTDFSHLCGSCGMCFRERDELRTHMNKRHANLYSHVCKVCRLGFGTAAQLEIHMRKHTGEKPYFCHLCRKSFRTLGAIIQHINYHSKDPIFECYDCGRRFYSRKKLMRHIKTHSIVHVYNCNECGRSFQSRHCQRVHELIHATEQCFPCKLCGKIFKRFAARHNHMRLMHKSTPAGKTGTRPLAIAKMLKH